MVLIDNWLVIYELLERRANDQPLQNQSHYCWRAHLSFNPNVLCSSSLHLEK